MNAFTTKEYTAYYVRVLDESYDLALDILSDVVWSPAFRPDEVDCERQVILEEIQMHEDTPDELVHSIFAEALFPGAAPRPGGARAGVESIDAMTREADRRLPRPRTTGRQHRGGGGRATSSTTRSWPRSSAASPARSGDRAPRINAEVRPAARPSRARPAHRAGPPGARACPGCPASDPDRYALAVLNHVLGGGMSSRLFQEIRERRGLAYSVYSYRAAFEDTGMFAVYAGTAPSRVGEVLAIVSGELDRLVADRGMEEGELERAKGHFKGQLALSLEGSSPRMERLGRSELTAGEVLDMDELVARIDAVGPEDVARVIERVIDGAPRVLAAVGPIDESDLDPRAGAAEILLV